MFEYSLWLPLIHTVSVSLAAGSHSSVQFSAELKPGLHKPAFITVNLNISLRKYNDIGDSSRLPGVFDNIFHFFVIICYDTFVFVLESLR